MPAGDVWGNAWGDSWNSYWKTAVAAAQVVEVIDTHDGRPRPDYGQEARDRERASEDALRVTVEREFRRLMGEEPESQSKAPPLPVSRPASKKEIRTAARAILPEVDAAGFDVGLRRVEALLADLQAENMRQREAAIAAVRRREDEALILLMAS